MAEKKFFSEADLNALVDLTHDVLSPADSLVRAPMPQVFLVTRDSAARGSGVSVRTTTLTPLSWLPYTMAVSIPMKDDKIVRGMSTPDAECVLALPSRGQLRQLTLCAQWLPAGISEAEVARFKMFRSQVVDLPGIEDCPVNFECRVEHLQPYYHHQVAFLRVVGANIDSALLFKERQEIVAIYPPNLVDEIDIGNRALRRVSMIQDLFLCPTFPLSPKQGWYATFQIWLYDLLVENYITQSEYEKLTGWDQSWEKIFFDLDSPERGRLRENITYSIRLIVRKRWDELHSYLTKA